MPIFDPGTFRQFLGEAVCCSSDVWGTEQHYVVSGTSLEQYEQLLKDTIYHHHSSFDFANEIADVGYPLTAQAMRQRDSGNPADHNTQMGNLGEVLGAEFARAFLGMQTTLVLPKRLNPNVDQSMKGADIIGLRDSHQPPELLFGESKCDTHFSKRSIDEGYDHLVDLHAQDASRMLRFVKEVLRLKGDKEQLANVDRHMAHGVPRLSLILAVTQSAPQAPFDVVAERFKQEPLPQLVAVHIRICDLTRKATKDEDDQEESWLSKLFAP